MKNLVIVESPAKAKTIEKFLGADYRVMSSHGHIRDLRKKGLGIDLDKNFQPVYEVPEDKTALVKDLKKAAKEAEKVWLASDEDREGEAIAWHLYETLGLKGKDVKRIVFHEITKDAILHAIANPREIDRDLVNAQQARRVLDRLVGFELSPVLWRKVKPSLSAGRVQSVAVRLIADREKEIHHFVTEPFYRVNGTFSTPAGESFKAEMSRRLHDDAEAQHLLQKFAQSSFTIGEVTVKPVRKSPAPPFTTSTLQQEASRKLGFPVSLTMSVAQKLYEAGLITYMRTDSLNLSNLALASMAKLIEEKAGKEYLQVRHYHTSSKGAQEAHEAIRPTYIERDHIPGTEREQKLYRLIRQRALASQMADAQLERTTAEIIPSQAPEHPFTASGEVVKFKGFMLAYMSEGDEVVQDLLPPLQSGEEVKIDKITATERFTMPPARYNEGSLVKKLEELGIGRPSTYAPIISTIQAREYVEKGDKPGTPRQFQVLELNSKGQISQHTETENAGSDKGRLVPTDMGIIVNDYLTEHFPDILNYEFTAGMEQKFDRIAEGDSDWSEEISGFYDLFHPEVEKAANQTTEHKVGERLLGTHPDTGEPVSVKIGRFGPMIQIGNADDEKKPRFASLNRDQSVFDITLEQALKLFELPRTLGEYEGKTVVAAVGRFGPFIRHDSKFTSIPKEESPLSITLERAIELIEAKRKADAEKTIKIFAEEPEIQILNGRWGPYIKSGKDNFKIPKTITNPQDLSLEDVKNLIASQPVKKKKTKK